MNPADICIEKDDLRGEAIANFLQQHIDDMRAVSPPESKHALDIEGLRAPEITFWTAYSISAKTDAGKGSDGGKRDAAGDRQIVGCIALKELPRLHAGKSCPPALEGEIKSMRVAESFRNRGIAKALVAFVIEQAEMRGYQCLSLETGSMPFFKPAQALYGKMGFAECPPFANYKQDPNSLFLSKRLF
ncbi:GNAT family N-acetyltransferase [Halioxenophilus aromaticivorans]|uniref:GNAT family N-acetyltransferase n=1 Tax=Halioxenophilus aromaticivorans TaxID=1306992 RepID=A0AAV3TXI2_9ALTE